MHDWPARKQSVGSFSNDDGDGNENGKKAIGLISKTFSLHVYHTFLYISLPSLHDYDVKMPNFTSYGERKQATTVRIFLSLFKLESGRPRNQGKLAHISHFQLIGINATKFEKPRIHFKGDFFAAVAVVDAKAL